MTFSITKHFLGSNKGIKLYSPRLGYPTVSIFLGSHLSSWFSTAWMTSVCSCAANTTRISADSRLQCTGCVCTGRSFSSDGCVSGWRHEKWIVFPGLLQRSVQGNPWLSLQLLPGGEEYAQCLHPSASSFTAPDFQHWKLGKKAVFRKVGLNRPQELSIYLRQPGQAKWRRCPDQESWWCKMGGKFS